MVSMPPGYYYGDGYDMNAKEITVLMAEPGQHPKVTTSNNLDSLQMMLLGFSCFADQECFCKQQGKVE